MDLNKGISTPIAIGLIVVISVVVGVLVWQFTKPAEEPTPKQASDYTTQSACEEADYYWYDDACHEKEQEDSSDKSEPTTSKSVSLTSPNGGEQWKAGETYEIKWNSEGVDKVNIEYGNGKSWRIVYGVDADKGEYSWEIPEDIVESYSGAVPEEISEFDTKVLIWDADKRDISDKSDDVFTVFEEDEATTEQPSDYTAPATCENAGYYWYDQACHEESRESITVTSPDGGEVWELNSTHDITWQSNKLDKVIVWLRDYSKGINFKACRLTDGYLNAEEGNFSWEMGSGNCDISPGDKFKIAVTEPEGMEANLLSDESDDYFTISE